MKKPKKGPPEDMKLSFYTTDLHEASFVLPKFVLDELDK